MASDSDPGRAPPDSGTPDTPDKAPGGGKPAQTWAQEVKNQGAALDLSGPGYLEVRIRMVRGAQEGLGKGPTPAQEAREGADTPDGPEEAPGEGLCGVCGADSGACSC